MFLVSLKYTPRESVLILRSFYAQQIYKMMERLEYKRCIYFLTTSSLPYCILDARKFNNNNNNNGKNRLSLIYNYIYLYM